MEERFAEVPEQSLHLLIPHKFSASWLSVLMLALIQAQTILIAGNYKYSRQLMCDDYLVYFSDSWWKGRNVNVESIFEPWRFVKCFIPYSQIIRFHVYINLIIFFKVAVWT